MIRHAHTLRELLARIRGQAVGEAGPYREDLELVPSLQPVLLAGDRSHDTPWPRAARGILGSAIVAGVGATTYGELDSIAAGGTRIDWAIIGSEGAPTDSMWRFDVGPTTATNAIRDVTSIDPDFPVRAVFRAGFTTPPGITIGNKILFANRVNVYASPLFFEGFWIPPGRTLYLSSYTVTRALHCSFHVTEYPVLG